jgi:uncharacterized protein YukE
MNSLEQGLKYQNQYYRKKQQLNNRLHMISNSNNLETFYEGMTNMEIQNEYDKMTEDINTIQNKYDNELENYKKLYSEYITKLTETSIEDEDLVEKVYISNTKLIGLTEQLLEKGKEIELINEPVYSNLENNRKVILKEARKLQKQRDLLVKEQKENNTLIGKYITNTVDIRSKYYNYMAYTIGAVSLSMIALYKLTNN